MFPRNLTVYFASQSHCLAVLVEFKIEITSFLTASIMNWLTVVKFCEGRKVPFVIFRNAFIDVYGVWDSVSNTATRDSFEIKLSEMRGVEFTFTLRCGYSCSTLILRFLRCL